MHQQQLFAARSNKPARSRPAYAFLSALAFCCALCYAEGDIRVSADNQFYFARNTYFENAADSIYRYALEDWAAVTVGYGDFEANIVYEAHQPRPSWGSDTTGQGIYERWFTYKRENLRVTAGNFYALLGKGITLRSFNNRELRYNSNIDGVQFQYSNKFLDITALGGRPRDFAGYRLQPLQGGEIRVTPVPWGFLGITAVRTQWPSDKRETYWASSYSQVQGAWGSVYAELASRDFFKDNGNMLGGSGTAFYSTANYFMSKLSGLLEVAYYNNFDLSEGNKMFNNPPPTVLEHSSALMSRVQPTFNAANDAAVHAGFTYAITDQNNVSLNISRARGWRASKEFDNTTGDTLYPEKAGFNALLRDFNFNTDSGYTDLFLKGEAVYPEKIDWTAGIGLQKTLDARYLNFLIGADIGIMENYSMQAEFEHQHTTLLENQEKHYSQLYSITVARASAPRIALSLISDIVVEPEGDTVGTTVNKINHLKTWFGTQVNWTFYENNELSVFVGKRKKGKICSGGVCVIKPEFSGVEITFTTRL